MAHFAEINENNIVMRVLVTDNNAHNEGYDWLIENLGGTWIQTSYNGNIRKNFAGIGYSYDAERDAFMPPKPFDSWILDEETCQWQPPKPYPTDEKAYFWNEETLDWELSDFANEAIND
jgi:hypothetical protein